MSDMLDIAAVARRTNFTPAYVRTLIRRGQLKSEMLPVAVGSTVKKHYVSEEVLDAYLENSTRKTKRTDGRNKYVFYADPTEYNKVLEALNAAGLTEIVASLKTANHIKPPYRPRDEHGHGV